MEFSSQEKIVFLKAFTDILKEANGKGPKNIYIKYFSDEIHIFLQGIISEFDKYLIRNFGQEAIDTLTYFFQRACQITEKDFMARIGADNYNLKFIELESDFFNDLFVYKLKVETDAD